ncbi:MAG: glycosyltransferase family 39 protein [Candidatus Moranbacteria bacterium]|nr:glycosyltransferase family 39 protein [Candidatus Moranbacteria bacterium]
MKYGKATFLIFLVIITSSFYFGYSRLSHFSGVDESFWSYDRVPTFWNAVSEMRWKKTNISDKPGIPLAIISGAGLPFLNENPKDLKGLRYKPKTFEQLQQIRDSYFHLRLPIFLFTLAVMPLFYWIIKKLLGKDVARFSLIFIGLSPILLGISLIINADAMLWILSALSTLSLFVFLKNNEKKYLLLSGFFLGLSVITKYVANVLFIYFFALFFLEYILHAHKNMSLGKYLKIASINYLLLFATAMATAFLFFPATWVKFSVLIKATVGNVVFASVWPIFVGIVSILALDALIFKTKFSSILFNFLIKHKRGLTKTISVIFLLFIIVVFLHIFFKINIFDIQGMVAAPKGIGLDLDTRDPQLDTLVASQKGTGLFDISQRYIGAILADFYSLIFSISPIILFAILFAASNIVRKKDMGRDSITAIYIIFFILLFYLGSTIDNVIATVRYQIMIYPLAFILAAIGISELIKIEKVGKYLKLPVAYALIIPILLSSLFFIKPNYFAYSSEILPSNFLVNLKGMGEGSYEATDYLNNLPNAQNIAIWSDKATACDQFVGSCYWNKSQPANVDYYVVSTDRKSRTLKSISFDLTSAYENEHPAFEVLIGNNPNNFVKVIKSIDLKKTGAQ